MNFTMSATNPVVADLPELSPQSLQPYLKGNNGYAGGRGQVAPNGVPIPSYSTTPMRVPTVHSQLFLDLCILYRSLCNIGESEVLMERLSEIVYGWRDENDRRWVLSIEEQEAIEREQERQRLEKLQQLEEAAREAEKEVERKRVEAEVAEQQRLEAEKLKLEAIERAAQERLKNERLERERQELEAKLQAEEEQRLEAMALAEKERQQVSEKQRELDAHKAEAQSVAQQVEQERAARLAAETKLHELQEQFQLLQAECQQLRDHLTALESSKESKNKRLPKGFGS